MSAVLQINLEPAGLKMQKTINSSPAMCLRCHSLEAAVCRDE